MGAVSVVLGFLGVCAVLAVIGWAIRWRLRTRRKNPAGAWQGSGKAVQEMQDDSSDR